MFKTVLRLGGLAFTILGGLATVANYFIDDKKMEVYVKEEVNKRFQEMDADYETVEENKEEAEAE